MYRVGKSSLLFCFRAKGRLTRFVFTSVNMYTKQLFCMYKKLTFIGFNNVNEQRINMKHDCNNIPMAGKLYNTENMGDRGGSNPATTFDFRNACQCPPPPTGDRSFIEFSAAIHFI